MAVDIKNLVAAIAPDVYADKKARGSLKEFYSEKAKIVQKEIDRKKEKGKDIEDKDYSLGGAYLEAITKPSFDDKKLKDKFKDLPKSVRLVEPKFMNLENIFMKNPWTLSGYKNPIEQHTLEYDSFGEALEPVYFWILDYINREIGKAHKFVDNFVASPGSAVFSETGRKATMMQEEAMKILGAANQVVKSILNLIYDLKEFQLRLQIYDKFNSAKGGEKEAALLSLKQVWLDTVDIKRGNTSIKAMSLGQGAQFITLIDAFMAAEDETLMLKGSPMDLNDRIARILKQRLLEFKLWIKESERELRKRFDIEKLYLASQVNTVKMYARWAKPYLKAAKMLEQADFNDMDTPELVNQFNSALFELVLLGEGKWDYHDVIATGDLPKTYKNITSKKFNPCVLVEIRFLSVPERQQQGGYGFRGRFKIVFSSFALRDDEIKVLRDQIERDNMKDLFKAMEGATDESIGKIQEDIDELLGLKEKKDESEKKEEKIASQDIDPFSALFSIFKSDSPSSSKQDKKIGLPKDTDEEKIIRSLAIIEARKKCIKMYEKYKKEHGMPSIPTPF